MMNVVPPKEIRVINDQVYVAGQQFPEAKKQKKQEVKKDGPAKS